MLPWNRRYVSLLLIVISVVVALGAAEITLRYWPTQSHQLSSSQFKTKGNFYLYQPLTRVEWTNELGEVISFTTDQLGLRNDPAKFRESGRRVLVLGDSFVEASNTPDAQMFTTRLEEFLKSDSDADVTVINGGIGGFSTAHEFWLLTTLWSVIKPDMVILVAYLGNDLLDNYHNLPDRSAMERAASSPPPAQRKDPRGRGVA